MGDGEAVLRIFEQQTGTVIGGLWKDDWVIGLANAKKEVVDGLRMRLAQIVAHPLDVHTLVEVAPSSALMLLTVT